MLNDQRVAFLACDVRPFGDGESHCGVADDLSASELRGDPDLPRVRAWLKGGRTRPLANLRLGGGYLQRLQAGSAFGRCDLTGGNMRQDFTL